MDVEHLDPEAGGLDGGFSHCIRNIVKLKVEKDFPAQLLNQTHSLGAGMSEKLLANLEHTHFLRQAPDQ
jgi:hypothetical protein